MSTLKTNNIQHVDRSDPSIIISTDGGVSIAGTLTYEDVTSVDAVGIVTAREILNAQKQVHVGTGVSVKAGGINVTAGITTLQAVTGTTAAFSGDVSIADKIIHTGDTDTAIRFPSANVISFEAAGSERVRIGSSGNFGVGTNNPTTKVHIQQSAVTSAPSRSSALYLENNANCEIQFVGNSSNDCQLRFGTSSNSFKGAIEYELDNNNLIHYTNGSERMRIASDGKIGMGGITSPRSILDLGNGSGDGTLSTTLSQYQLMLEAPQTTGDYGRNIGWSVGTNGLVAAINAVDNGTSDSTGLAFVTGNNSSAAERLRIQSDGKVGINTASAAQQFTSYAASGYPILANGPSNGIGLGGNGVIVFGTYNLGSYAPGTIDASTFAIKISGSEKLKIASDGSMGLGTTPETDGQASSLYFAGGNANIWGSGNANLYTAVNARYTGAGGWKYNNNGLASYAAQQSGVHHWYNAPSGTADNVATFTERMRLTADGYFHLGQSVGTNKVGGQNNTGQDFDPIFKIYNNVASKWLMHLRQDTATAPNGIFMRAGNASTNYTMYLTNNDENIPHLVVRGDGRVGIKESSPVNILTVSSSVTQDDALGNLQVRYTGSTTTINSGITVKNYNGTSQLMQWETNGCRIGNRIVTNSGTGHVYFTAGSDTVRLSINASTGNFAGSGSADISDGRLKENIASISNATATIKQLLGKTFTWKEEAKLGTDTKYGFIAQELKTVLPDLVYQDVGINRVSKDADKQGYGQGEIVDDYSDDYKDDSKSEWSMAVSTSGIIPVLVEAFKELEARVAAIEKIAGI